MLNLNIFVKSNNFIYLNQSSDPTHIQSQARRLRCRYQQRRPEVYISIIHFALSFVNNFLLGGGVAHPLAPETVNWDLSGSYILLKRTVGDACPYEVGCIFIAYS